MATFLPSKRDSYLREKSSPDLARSSGLWTWPHSSFSVNCKFPIDNATVYTLKVTGEEDSRSLVPPGEEVDSLSARPMHKLGSISSTLTISIKRDEMKELDEEGTETAWDDNEALYSDVPAALFGKYDSLKDPGKVKNPQSLLNGTSEKTLHVMSGVRLRRPGDKFSIDPDVSYNVELFQLSNIKPTFKIPDSPGRSEELEGAPWPDTPGSNHWETVRDTWTTPGAGAPAAEQAATLWQELGLNKFGWDTERLKGSDSIFTGAQPQRLLDDLEKHYLWAPLLSRG